MPEMSDIFVLQADPTAYVQAMALADAAANQSKAVIKGLAQAAIEGDKEMVAALQQLTGNYAPLKGKIDEVKSAYKEWIQAQAKGSDDVAAKEDAYKARLGEVQALTTASAAAAVNARKELLAVTDSVTVAEQKAGAAADHTATIAAAGNAVVKEGMAEKIALYARLSKEEDELRAKMNATFRDAANGVPKAAEAYAVLDGQLKKVVQSKAAVGQEAGVAGGKMMNMNFALGQLSYGAQDFVTVLMQPGMGLDAALRSTGNNIGVVAQVMGGPLAGALATVGIMGAAFAAGMMKSSDSTKQAKKDGDDFIGTLQGIASGAKEATTEIDDMVRAQIDLGDIEYSKVAAPITAEIMRLKGEISDLDLEKAKRIASDKSLDAGQQYAANVRIARGKELEKELFPLEQKKQAMDRVRADAAERMEKRKSSKGIDQQFDRVDEPLKATARIEAGMADAFGSIDEGAAVGRIIERSGIKPKNEAEAARLRERAQGLLDKSKEQIAGESERERLMSKPDREKKDAEFRRGVVQERREVLDRPLSEMQGAIQNRRDELQRLKDRNRSDGSEGGKSVTFKEKEAEKAMEQAIHRLTEVLHQSQRDKEKELKLLEEQLKATRENTKAKENAAAVAAAGGVGFRLALNPFGGL